LNGQRTLNKFHPDTDIGLRRYGNAIDGTWSGLPTVILAPGQQNITFYKRSKTRTLCAKTTSCRQQQSSAAWKSADFTIDWMPLLSLLEALVGLPDGDGVAPLGEEERRWSRS